jgi:L-threonylcarbamoyladenylate synthase
LSDLAAQIRAAVSALARGGLVVYPTETVYGLGADARSGDALSRLLRVKGRSEALGLSILVRDLDAALPWILGDVPETARTLAQRFWPGPLTLVLPASAAVDRALIGPAGGVGLRVSADRVASRLGEAFAAPLTSTSANPSGSAPATDAASARAYFAADVDVYVDDGPRTSSAVSSVVEFLDGRAYLRRVGAVSAEDLARHIELEY